jgi:hypothetical protein
MFTGIIERVRGPLAALEDQRIDQLRAELQKNVDFALARLEETKRGGHARGRWTQLNVPNTTFEYQSPNFPFVQWSPSFKLRAERAFEPILKGFFDILELESLGYRMSQRGFLKGGLKSTLARVLPRNRHGDNPFMRYYITINVFAQQA